MTPTERPAIPEGRLGWLAGLIEGEGWQSETGGRPVVRVTMADEDVIERLREWSGLGNVTGPHAPREHQTKSTWTWQITKRDDAAWFLAALLPWFGERRAARTREILAAYEAAGPTKGTADTCEAGHDIRPESGNLRLDRNGKYTKRRCRLCINRRAAEYRARKAARANAA